MFGLDDQSIPHWQALGSGKKERKSLQKMLKKLGKKRSRAHSSDSDSSESSEDELDGEAVGQQNLSQTQLQWYAYVQHTGTEEQMKALKKPEKAFRAEALLQVQTERRNLEAAYVNLYEQWRPRLEQLFSSWQVHRGRQLEAELTANKLALLAQSPDSSDGAKLRFGWQLDTQRNIVMQREVELRTILEELNKMKQSMSFSQQEGKPFEFAELWMKSWRQKQRAFLDENPEARKELKATEREFDKLQKQIKEKSIIDTLVALRQDAEVRPAPRKGRGEDERPEKKKRRNEDEPNNRFPPLELVKADKLSESLKGSYIPKLSSATSGYKGKYLLSKPATEGFKYECAICLRKGHHFMHCGAKELSLPGVVTRPDGVNKIVTYRELYKKGLIDAEGKKI